MRSATTIRLLGNIVMFVSIAVAVILGILFLNSDNDLLEIFAIPVIIVLVIVAFVQKTMLDGFADIIDNTYAIACKLNDIPVNSAKDMATNTVTFRQPVSNANGQGMNNQPYQFNPNEMNNQAYQYNANNGMNNQSYQANSANTNNNVNNTYDPNNMM
ncbi:hypothetical protein [Lachnospira pectinoschiza]|uniref:Uncharacterized protein n=1 Tax=Lachnospira pectinoschiza TaxID=28052 RepID=A0A1G9TKX5_9FIRM|nr:hypothetical protein [Lachnospira pectinoschiza]SDM48290.1 hypothetical protein SAMN05216544_0394 [Lachnospira pectinoschiza]